MLVMREAPSPVLLHNTALDAATSVDLAFPMGLQISMASSCYSTRQPVETPGDASKELVQKHVGKMDVTFEKVRLKG